MYLNPRLEQPERFFSAVESCMCARAVSILFVEFDYEPFCLRAAKCVSGVPFLCFAGGSLKAV
jgi:hypothetical protein